MLFLRVGGTYGYDIYIILYVVAIAFQQLIIIILTRRRARVINNIQMYLLVITQLRE